jgi:predicted secreted protein
MFSFSKRILIKSLLLLPFYGRNLLARDNDVALKFLKNEFPNYKIIKDKVIGLKSPLLVDSGNYVPIEIIQFKKNDSIFFEKILLFALKNPNPLLVSFSMTKGVSTNIKTRIRLSDSQNIFLVGITNSSIFFDYKKTDLLTPGCDV